MTTRQKCLVVGADGFIGRHLVRELVSKGYDVRAFDRFRDYAAQATHEFSSLEGVEVYPGDFLNRDNVSMALEGVEYVFHLVSTTNPFVSANDPFIDIDTNIRGSVELFDLCARTQSVKKVIYFSSGGTVYGEQSTPMLHEELCLKPLSPYGIGKVTVENYLRYFKNTYDLNYIVYRIANPYGEGQNLLAKQGVIPIFLHHILNNEPVTVYGDGTMTRDYLYITDVSRIITNTFSKDNKFPIYNLGSGGGRSVSDLISAIELVTGKQVQINYTDTPSSFVHTSVLDTKRLEDEFDLRPEVSLEDGIKKTWSYVKRIEHGNR